MIASLFAAAMLLMAADSAPLDVAPVWSAHPVGFSLLTHGGHQFVAFYSADRQMTVAERTLPGRVWRFTRLDSKLAWDSHNSLTLAVDSEGYLHLSGNMHVVPLVYFRSTRALDASSLERVPSMVGRDEEKCTYPVWLKSARGELIFTYRDGRSGSGNQIYNIYDAKARTWKRLLDQPLTDGQGRMNAYFQGPLLGPDGWWHLVWTWRDTPDCSTNHDLSYARSRDLTHWETSDGRLLPLPIKLETAEIVDRVPVKGGMINGNTKIGFDSQNRVVIAYHKFDEKGFTQIMLARREKDGWKTTQVSDWQYRWDFQGGGTIPFEITHGAVSTGGRGRLRLSFRHEKYGSGEWTLDDATLRPVATGARSPGSIPAAWNDVESSFSGMRVNVTPGSGDGRYYLRWETLGPNRDRPRPPPLPEPTMLRVLELPR
ncbi:MAG: BNR repeat-containing protein [Bryobacteraceae bacterium]|nr:BNR repeat-containing protein [Bryobacteraceae bacterium]